MQKPLSIGIDVRDLWTARTGTRTYLRELCNEFEKMDSDEIHFHFINTSIPVYTGNKKIFRLVEHLRYQVWKQLILPLKAFFKNCDIVFCTDNCVPMINLGYKTIPVFHDAFCFESPEHYGKLWLWLYKKTAVPAARKSPFVVTPTEYAKKQINHFTHIPNGQLVVIPEGPKSLENDEVSDGRDILQSLSLSAGNYIFHVGSMYKRKNIPALIQAFGKIKQSGYANLKLVLAGPTPINKFGDYDFQLILKAIADTNLKNDVILTGYITDGALSQLYKDALLYVFPSINEGFGIPVLEAFRYALPVLVADNTCLPEVGGDAVMQFNPFDIDDMALKIKTVLDDAALRGDMINRGTQRLKLFSWHNTALQLIEVFKKAV